LLKFKFYLNISKKVGYIGEQGGAVSGVSLAAVIIGLTLPILVHDPGIIHLLLSIEKPHHRDGK